MCNFYPNLHEDNIIGQVQVMLGTRTYLDSKVHTLSKMPLERMLMSFLFNFLISCFRTTLLFMMPVLIQKLLVIISQMRIPMEEEFSIWLGSFSDLLFFNQILRNRVFISILIFLYTILIISLTSRFFDSIKSEP